MAENEPTKLHPSTKDLLGKRFGILTVVALARTTTHGKSIWRVRCDCGTTKEIHCTPLAMGNHRSCGCKRTSGMRRHGMYKSRVYRIWLGLRQRCNNPSNPRWADYGGRGIGVCSRWNDFECFLADMSVPPTSKHSIDRANNDGNYEPSNCRWATNAEQRRNGSRVQWISYNGETMCIMDWAVRLGIKHSTLARRLKKWNDIERAFFAPIRQW